MRLQCLYLFHLRSSCRFCVIPDNANSSKSKMWEFADRGRPRAITYIFIRVNPLFPCASVCYSGLGRAVRVPCSLRRHPTLIPPPSLPTSHHQNSSPEKLYHMPLGHKWPSPGRLQSSAYTTQIVLGHVLNRLRT